MAGVESGNLVAPRAVARWRGLLPHAVMVAVMVYVVVGGHSPTKCLLGAAVLVVGSVVMAPSARRSVATRLNIVDYWAMAIGMLVLLPHRVLIDSPNLHDHGGGLQAGGVPLFLVVCAVWVIARVVFALTVRYARGRSALLFAVLTAASLAVMFVFCR